MLTDAVHTSDSNVVALMGSLSEALSYLKEKYQSSFSLLEYFQKKLSKKRMSSCSTIAYWQDFFECVTEAMLVAEQGDDLVRSDFINTVCRCLPYQLLIQLAVATREDWKKVAPFIKDHLYGVRTTDKTKGQQIGSKHKQPTKSSDGKRAEKKCEMHEEGGCQPRISPMLRVPRVRPHQERMRRKASLREVWWPRTLGHPLPSRTGKVNCRWTTKNWRVWSTRRPATEDDNKSKKDDNERSRRHWSWRHYRTSRSCARSSSSGGEVPFGRRPE